MINNEVKLFSTTSSSKKCCVTVNSEGKKCVKESSEHVEVSTQVCEEESKVLIEHGGSISER